MIFILVALIFGGIALLYYKKYVAERDEREKLVREKKKVESECNDYRSKYANAKFLLKINKIEEVKVNYEPAVRVVNGKVMYVPND